MYIGLDIGGTKCAAVLGVANEEFEIVEKISFATAGKTPEQILNIFSDFIAQQKTKHTIEGIGIACGGPLDSKKGIIKKPPSLPLWDDIKIVKYLLYFYLAISKEILYFALSKRNKLLK